MNIIIFPGRPNRSEIETKTLIKTWDSFAIIISLLFFTTAMIRSSVVVDYKKLLWPAFPPDVYFFFFSVRVVWWVYGDALLSLARIHYLFSSIAVQLWNFFPYLRLLIPILCWTTRELSSNETCYEKTLGIATVFRFSPLITTSILDRPRDLSLIAFHENQLYLSCIGDTRLLWNTYSVENNLLYHRKN